MSQTTTGLPSPVVTTPTGKHQISLAVLGVDVMRVALLAELTANLLVVTVPTLASQVAPVIKAAQALQAAGVSLMASGATTGDLHANLTALQTALVAIEAGAGTQGGDVAARVKAAVEAVSNAITMAETVLATPVAAGG